MYLSKVLLLETNYRKLTCLLPRGKKARACVIPSEIVRVEGEQRRQGKEGCYLLAHLQKVEINLT